MNSTIFYILLFVHVVSFITGFGAVIVIDTFGLLWILKFKPMDLVMKVADVTQRLIWLGWAGLVASGIPMLYIKGHIDNLTKIKLFLVIMIGLNGIFLHFIKKGIERSLAQGGMTTRDILKMSLASGISQLGWWGAVSIGFVHRHINHVIEWPSNPYVFMIAIAVCISLAGAVIAYIPSRR